MSDPVVRHDDLGHPVTIKRPIRRIVSLVPSLTESIATTRPDALVGATDWCTQPADLDVPRVRGTKNPDRARIAALQPDLVLANQEENRRVDVQKLRAAGIEVWVTVIETVEQALASLRRLIVEALDWPSPPWLDDADRAWSAPTPTPTPMTAPTPTTAIPAVIAIWRDPWMVVGRDTLTGDLAERLGLRNLYRANPDRYPHVEIADVLARRPQLVVLPDEPYRFTAADGPEAFPDTTTVLVEGRLLTWYGPSLAYARSKLIAQINGDLSPNRK